MIRFPRPAEGEVHIRCIGLDAAELQVDRREGLLSQDERDRADRLLNPQARNQFVTGRVFLRQVISGYLGIGPENIELALSEHGKPHLKEGSASASGLAFNLAHSGELILLAVTAGQKVGIDLELVRDDLPLAEMSRLACSALERRELNSLPEHLRPAAFYRCWTRKEAFLKGSGYGFRLACDSFDVSLLPGSPPLLRNRRGSDHRSIWQLFDIAVPERYCAALAVEYAGRVRLSHLQAFAA